MRKSTSLQRLSRKCVQIFFRPGPDRIYCDTGWAAVPCSAYLAESGCCETLQCLGGRGHTHTYKHDKWRYVHLFTGNMSSVSDMSPVDYAIRCSQFFVFYSIKLETRSLLTLVYSSLVHTLSHTLSHTHVCLHTHPHAPPFYALLHAHTRTLERSHTHAHSNTRTHELTITPTYAHAHFTYTMSCMHAHSRMHSDAHTHTHTHAFMHAHTRAHSFTHACSHTHMHMHTLMILTVTSPSPHH